MSVGSPELLVETEGAAEEGLETAGAEIAARSPRELVWRRFRADRVAVVSLGFIVVLILIAIFAPLVVKLVGAPGPYTPDNNAVNQFGLPAGPSRHATWPFEVLLVGAILAMLSRLVPIPPVRRYGAAVIMAIAGVTAIVMAIIIWPSANHIFGVDLNHLDVFSRVLYGARTSLEVALVATGISLVIGVVLGMVAGYFRGGVDMAISRVIDVLLAFPILLLALGIGAACTIGVGGQPSQGCLGGLLKPGLPVVIAVIAFVNWTYIARIVRGQVLSLREREFIDASRSLGASNRRIIFREILPNLWAPILVYATLIIPTNVLFEAALSYLGVGVRYPTASWGKMLSDASGGNLGIGTVWWLMLFPGAALLLTVLAFNLLGDGLQDALNPRASRT
ncbi:MAG: ABC transporter permease [Solirubrobacterales bacterium]|nr:ABC transporter permease [Solirubrobacterales bacterium]MBV9714335.1 ABC transporter permease [Solirubrobacterales bacterium]